MPSIEFTKQPFWSRKRKRFWFRTVAILGVGIAGGVAAWPRAVNRYHRWNAHRHAVMASDALGRGDIRHAVLSARNALASSPLDIEATRVMAKSLDALGAPEAEQWRARLDALQPDDPENVIERAKAAIKAGAIEQAAQYLNRLQPGDRNSATFHSISAAIALKNRDNASAEAQLAEAARLEPAEVKHRLGLASIRLTSPVNAVRDVALKELQEMRGEPPTSVEALRVLLADAIRLGELTQLKNKALRRVDVDLVQEAADALVADPRCTFEDKLARVSALRKIGDERSGPYLLELRDASREQPANLFALLAWMNANNLSLMVAEWTRSFPAGTTAKPPVCKVVADALARAGDWQELRKMTAGSTWEEMDYLRRAFLARALEHLGDETAGAAEWAEACSAALSRPDKRGCMEQLAKFAIHSKWAKRAEEIMWCITAFPQCPSWIVDSLWKLAEQRGETARLQRLSSIRVKMDPKGVSSRNNYAFFSLLVRSEEGNPHREAERLFNENPGDAAVAITRGLSLYRQRKGAEADAVIASLPAAELQKPQVALYHAIFLGAAGESAKAAEFLPLADNWKMFPEEKALLERAKLAAAKAADEAGIAEAKEAARAARAAREIEAQLAVDAARAARAAQAAVATQVQTTADEAPQPAILR